MNTVTYNTLEQAVDLSDIIPQLLRAKDKRAALRMVVAQKHLPSVSLNLNIPGFPKSDEQLHAFFKHILVDFQRYLIANRILFDRDNAHCDTDIAGDFYLVPIMGDIDIKELKELTERFESSQQLGRLLDVDVTDTDGNPVSSGKAKMCYYCDAAPAVVCMREKSHSYEDIRKKITADVRAYLAEKKRENVCKTLAADALKSLLHEVALVPKPGLVDRNGSGSHTDMDFATFVDSASVIAVHFRDIAEYGYGFLQKNISEALPYLRAKGLEMEADMFAATGNVNTHKGAIFLMAFALFISAKLIAENNYSLHQFRNLLMQMNSNVVDNELHKIHSHQQQTHGEACFEKYGKKGTGIRGEVEAGLPSLFLYGLPVLAKYLNNPVFTDKALNRALTPALLSIIANSNDSNILFRKGEEALHKLQLLAQKALYSYDTVEFANHYQQLIDYCEKQHISPGGSADLLAVTLFLWQVNYKFGEEKGKKSL